ncbi:membrane protein [Streptomyces chrestomyceticus JCM 4735]|uniref:Membrane protein n=1 Tax=Streptomyces chrestomyceticus JCM 4735 TaxID=1306181 RepID=A0A7U9PXI4_9ACTN|nr:ABC transporter permease [Streptomyces chrestomyceticus]GCD36397.1 membrane protein [Streptomyces chrestomyceticus JCM 4735]
MSSVRRPDHHRPDHRADLRHVLTHLVTPLLMCIGMGLAYLGAFAHPEPHHLPVAVVGSGSQAQVLAQSISDKAHGGLDVRTVGSRAEAVDQLKHQEIFGAYVMDAHSSGGGAPAGASGGASAPKDGESAAKNGAGAGVKDDGGTAVKHEGASAAGAKAAPELVVATAGSDTTATVVQKIFTPVAAQQGAPLKVTDVAPPAEDDPTGQGIFFLMVAVSIGSYASVAVIGGAGAVLPIRLRAALAVGTSFVVSILGTLFAGPVFHLVDHGLWGLWSMAWLYSAGILLIGTGLHTFLKRWTTLGVMALFVMLNFTSAGGVFRPELQNGFFASLHAFWNGAGFVEGTRSHVYFDNNGLAGHVWTLVLWLVVGFVMIGVASLAEARRRRAAAAAAQNATAVAAAAVAATVPERRPAHAAGAGDGENAERAGRTKAAEEAEEEMEEAVGV